MKTVDFILKLGFGNLKFGSTAFLLLEYGTKPTSPGSGAEPKVQTPQSQNADGG